MKLVEGFSMVPAGEDVLLLLQSIVAKPKARPTVIEATFVHENGATIKNRYNLVTDPKTKEIALAPGGGAYAFSALARCVLGQITDFQLKEDLPRLAGKHISCTVEHTQPNEKGNVFANIKRTHRVVEVATDVADDEDDFDE